jgi:hypothetical protein
MDKFTGQALIAEGGPVESTTVAIYGMVSLSLLGIGLTRLIDLQTAASWKAISRPRHPFLLAIFVAIFAARELDFHSRWTGGNVLKTSFYVSADISLIEKGIVLLILGAVAVATLLVVYRYKSMVFEQCRMGKLEGILPLVGVLLVISSKGLDTGVGSLLRVGVTFSDTAQTFLHGMEEFSELLIPVFFAAMLVRSIRVRVTVDEQHQGETNMEKQTEVSHRMAA